MAWHSSNRRSELPPNWGTLRQRVIRRDKGLCQGVLDTGGLCGHPGTDVDHIRPGNDHSLSNLQLLCPWCHKRKTQAESAQARSTKSIPKQAIPRDQREATPDPW
ncbi:HNH endonuclease [Streptomyces phage Shady]|uniref:HNH endonuclease n=1 Tax=Streptomyces phage Shady TaxID=2767585 RepID=A0A873WHJ5_9CAUD|nr:HNH endonuclease [Streptomyces phage Shady]